MFGWIELLIVILFVFFCLMTVPLGVLVMLGGWRMMHGRSYGLSVASSFLAMLPCQPLFPLGLLFGIWSLVVLSRPQVKSAFEQADARGGKPTKSG
ncbi:MAG: hypothetical protein RIC55_29810 [Pirellulaceae bacterium]